MLDYKAHRLLLSIRLDSIEVKRPIIGVNLNVGKMEYYNDISEAEKKYKDKKGMILNSCNSSEQKAFGLHWAFLFG